MDGCNRIVYMLKNIWVSSTRSTRRMCVLFERWRWRQRQRRQWRQWIARKKNRFPFFSTSRHDYIGSHGITKVMVVVELLLVYIFGTTLYFLILNTKHTAKQKSIFLRSFSLFHSVCRHLLQPLFHLPFSSSHSSIEQEEKLNLHFRTSYYCWWFDRVYTHM